MMEEDTYLSILLKIWWGTNWANSPLLEPSGGTRLRLKNYAGKKKADLTGITGIKNGSESIN
jgi:hypothetical protein